MRMKGDKETMAAHAEFVKGMMAGGSCHELPDFNPSVSEKQRHYMGAALARKRAGKSRKGDPHMSEEKLREFASKVK